MIVWYAKPDTVSRSVRCSVPNSTAGSVHANTVSDVHTSRYYGLLLGRWTVDIEEGDNDP